MMDLARYVPGGLVVRLNITDELLFTPQIELGRSARLGRGIDVSVTIIMSDDRSNRGVGDIEQFGDVSDRSITRSQVSKRDNPCTGAGSSCDLSTDHFDPSQEV